MPASIPDLRLAIADDHTLYAQGIKYLLKSFRYINVVGLYQDGLSLLEDLDNIHPDLILMDIGMPRLNGIETTRLLTSKYPWVRVVAVSADFDGVMVMQMIKAGAKGYMTKDMSAKSFEEGLGIIMKGGQYIVPKAAEQYALYMMSLDKKISSCENEVKACLSAREKEIVLLVVQGFTDKEIANYLNLSIRTVEVHKRNIMHKTGVKKSTELVSYAYKMKWVS